MRSIAENPISGGTLFEGPLKRDHFVSPHSPSVSSHIVSESSGRSSAMYILLTLGLLGSFAKGFPTLDQRATDPAIWGYGTNTTGGAGAATSSIYTVHNYNEFKTALNNGGAPNAAKIIYIDGVISGSTLADGTPATQAYFARNTVYNWDLYLQSFNATYKAELAASSDPADAEKLALLNAQGTARSAAAVEQKKQVYIKIGANTSIIGKKDATVARVEEIALAIDSTTNVIFQDFEVYSPIDLFPEWDPTDGSTGNWNSAYDAISVIKSTNVWIDHLSVSDTNHPDSDEPTVFGHKVQRHDGAIDITDGSDLVTVSFTKIFNHDKTNLLGGSDSKTTDRGKLRVTFYGNHWQNSQQRSPRVRFGTVHTFNNYFEGSLAEPHALIYYLGMGINSTIISEANSFDIAGPADANAAADYVIGQYKGHVFSDNRSMVNGAFPDLEAVAKKKYDSAKAAEVAAAAAAGRAVAEWATYDYTDQTTLPTYFYRQKKAEDVKKWVLDNAGHGKL
ncbi:hypothetical protein FRC03_001266 [Tulasnella sp. 419]|nr:hypothetical protein FRC03_001266 [Tulasnella sp. 419]